MSGALAIPDTHLDLLNGATVTLSTVNDDGSVQSTAIWVHYDNGVLRTSLAKARRKYRNLVARSGQATLFAISPGNPFHTLEVRATVSFSEDVDRSFFAKLLAPYGHDLDTFAAQADEDRVIVTFHPTRVRAS